MKTLPIAVLMFLVGTFAYSSNPRNKKLIITYQENEEFVMSNPQTGQVLFLSEEISSLIKDGNIPIVIECDKDVAWIYLNDIYDGRDYPEVEFDSDYFNVIMDLYPVKINKELKKKLKKGNKAFIDALGIEYVIEGGEVVSKINYDKFEKFMF